MTVTEFGKIWTPLNEVLLGSEHAAQRVGAY
jgi:hypothetical protein